MFFSTWKTGFFGVLSILTELAHKIRKLTDFTYKQDREYAINQILFYGAGDETKRKTKGAHNLFIICYLLIEARHKIDICVPHLTSVTIYNSLIKARHYNNPVPIRLVLHNMTEEHKVRDLLKCGVEVKLANSKIPFNYEFALIDFVDDNSDAAAILGSFDYEMTRVNCNTDSTMITSELSVLRALQKEFNRLWHSPDNTVYDLKMVDI